MKRPFSLTTLAALLLGPTPALADDVLTTNNGIIRSNLCVGFDCSDPESYDSGDDLLRLKNFNARIHFNDISTAPFPANDWRIVANDSSSTGENYLAFEDDETGNMPLKVMAGASENALYVAANDRIGLGTSMPATDLHVHTNFAASLRLESFNFSANWDIQSGSTGLFFWDRSASSYPLVLENNAPSDSIWVNSTGNIGLGTNTPGGKLHTKGEGVQLAYFESSDGDAVQVRFRTDSQNRRFLAVNNANEVKSQIVFGDDEITFLGQTVANEWLRISDAGIISSGPSCSASPCDLTFDPEYFTVPPIEERAAYMWENMHLPAVGPTGPEQPFNVTEKMGGVIHELEIAHIYIEQLHDEILALRADHSATLAAQAADLQELRKLIEAN